MLGLRLHPRAWCFQDHSEKAQTQVPGCPTINVTALKKKNKELWGRRKWVLTWIFLKVSGSGIESDQAAQGTLCRNEVCRHEEIPHLPGASIALPSSFLLGRPFSGLYQWAVAVLPLETHMPSWKTREVRKTHQSPSTAPRLSASLWRQRKFMGSWKTPELQKAHLGECCQRQGHPQQAQYSS